MSSSTAQAGAMASRHSSATPPKATSAHSSPTSWSSPG
jgi:hypothetical protein